MSDLMHRESDRLLHNLERRIRQEYRASAATMRKRLTDFLAKFAQDDAKLKALVDAGKYDVEKYLAWRKAQIMQSQVWTQVSQTLAEDMANARKIAQKMIGRTSKDVYALNHNYATYEIEKQARVNTSYALYNHESVERLIKKKPNLLPHPGAKTLEEIATGKLERWNRQKIQSIATQAILQGDSIPRIAETLAKTLSGLNERSATRTARTMITGAEAAGRNDAFKRAEELGIEVKRQWVATLDMRTRHEHRELDGQIRGLNEPFEVDGEEIMYPGDPDAEPYLVYNCRCTINGVVEGGPTLADMPRYSDIGDMDYDEWKRDHEKGR